MPNFWHLPITPILKIQPFPLCMLIFRQKCFQFCTPCLKTPQPVLPYIVHISCNAVQLWLYLDGDGWVYLLSGYIHNSNYGTYCLFCQLTFIIINSCSGRNLGFVRPSKTQNLFTFSHNFFQPLTSWRLSAAVFVSIVWILSNYLLFGV